MAEAAQRFGAAAGDRGWIAPGGHYHAFDQPLTTHAGWIKTNRSTIAQHHEQLPSGMGTWAMASWMLRKGWTRKVAANQYHVQEPAHVPAVMQHVKSQHPNVQNVDLTIGDVDAVGEPDHTFTVPVGHPAPATRAALRPYAHKGGDVPDEFNVRAESMPRADRMIVEALMRSGSRRAPARAWIDPQGKVYPLRGVFQETGTTYHPEWVAKHQDLVQPHLAYDNAGWFRKGTFNRTQTMLNMLRGGWIRKASSTVYETGAEHFARVVDHFREKHPDQASARVRLHDKNGRTTEHIVRHT